MGDGVDATGHRHRHRQRRRELGVIDHAARQHPRVPAGLLAPIGGQTPHRGHLRPGVGGRHRHDRQAVLQRDGLAQPDCRASTDGHTTIGTHPGRFLTGALGDLAGHMHHRFGQHPHTAGAQCLGHPLAGVLLLRRAQDQHTRQPDRIQLLGQGRQGPGAEADPHGQGLVDELAGGQGRVGQGGLVGLGVHVGTFRWTGTGGWAGGSAGARAAHGVDAADRRRQQHEVLAVLADRRGTGGSTTPRDGWRRKHRFAEQPVAVATPVPPPAALPGK